MHSSIMSFMQGNQTERKKAKQPVKKSLFETLPVFAAPGVNQLNTSVQDI